MARKSLLQKQEFEAYRDSVKMEMNAHVEKKAQEHEELLKSHQDALNQKATQIDQLKNEHQNTMEKKDSEILALKDQHQGVLDERELEINELQKQLAEHQGKLEQLINN